MKDGTLGYPLFRDSTPQTNVVTLSFHCAVSETAKSKEERGSGSYPASLISQPNCTSSVHCPEQPTAVEAGKDRALCTQWMV